MKSKSHCCGWWRRWKWRWMLIFMAQWSWLSHDDSMMMIHNRSMINDYFLIGIIARYDNSIILYSIMMKIIRWFHDDIIFDDSMPFWWCDDVMLTMMSWWLADSKLTICWCCTDGLMVGVGSSRSYWWPHGCLQSALPSCSDAFLYGQVFTRALAYHLHISWMSLGLSFKNIIPTYSHTKWTLENPKAPRIASAVRCR